MDDGVLLRRVSPFGNLRIVAYVPLPEAYRSLSRPSSAPDAKAFPLRSFSLNLSMISHLWFSELCRLIRIIRLRNCYPNFFVPQLKLFLLLPCLSFLCSVFNVQKHNQHRGGLKWTRTTDLTIISRVL